MEKEIQEREMSNGGGDQRRKGRRNKVRGYTWRDELVVNLGSHKWKQQENERNENKLRHLAPYLSKKHEKTPTRAGMEPPTLKPKKERALDPAKRFFLLIRETP
ncbi:hypothetical protein Pyn_23550 [Prunus yedoensis var. nudiflora]|uniref:Uncharacterized protein n=1 Tax=Prunus yedoensis var. nudiflora TaxID=2094558 RepID=A0A314YX67_PRUYE|nr:hypothetical protein Pyn_23550 [Prunus yedoensis var. nudiflora]